MIYLENNVFDEAMERLRFIFDNHDDVIVSMSGGKDNGKKNIMRSSPEDSRKSLRFGRKLFP